MRAALPLADAAQVLLDRSRWPGRRARSGAAGRAGPRSRRRRRRGRRGPAATASGAGAPAAATTTPAGSGDGRVQELDLDPDDRTQPDRLGRADEPDRAVQAVVVGDGQAGQARARRPARPCHRPRRPRGGTRSWSGSGARRTGSCARVVGRPVGGGESKGSDSIEQMFYIVGPMKQPAADPASLRPCTRRSGSIARSDRSP